MIPKMPHTLPKIDLEESRNFLKEFREFAVKGNVVDLAVGVIIGAAFGKIITSLVNDILMPPIGRVMGGVGFTDLFINLDPQKTMKDGTPVHSLAQAKEAGVAVIAYGNFINTVLDFVIVAFCVFLLVKGINRLRRKSEAPPAPPAPSEEVKVLGEIRDLLQKRSP